MKNLLFFFSLLLVPWATRAQENDNRVYLDPCMKLCVVYYSDNSSSMNSAINDVHRWGRNLTLIPQSTGYVEIGVSTFGMQYNILCNPTGDKDTLRRALRFLSAMQTESFTYPSGGLYEIKRMLEKRKEKNPDEIQVVVMHSDYYFSDDHTNTIEEIQSIIKNDVAFIVSIPEAYDTNNGQIKMEAIKEIEEKGGMYIRSNFATLREFFMKLKSKIPCG